MEIYVVMERVIAITTPVKAFTNKNDALTYAKKRIDETKDWLNKHSEDYFPDENKSIIPNQTADEDDIFIAYDSKDGKYSIAIWIDRVELIKG